MSAGTTLKTCVLSSLAIPAVTGSRAAAGAGMKSLGILTLLAGCSCHGGCSPAGAFRSWQVDQPAAFFFSCLDPGSSQSFKAGTRWPVHHDLWHNFLLSSLLLPKQGGGAQLLCSGSRSLQDRFVLGAGRRGKEERRAPRWLCCEQQGCQMAFYPTWNLSLW